MSSFNKIAICLLFLCAGVNYAFSDIPEQINFSYISINEGLSQSTVFSIDQDQRGNMWFATYDGVNKYDGYSFTVYQHNEDDPNSIANDISRIVKADSQGRVWIGTRDGLSYYDEEKDLAPLEIYQYYMREVKRGVDTYWLSKPLHTGVSQRHTVTLEGGDQALRYKYTGRSDYVRY